MQHAARRRRLAAAGVLTALVLAGVALLVLPGTSRSPAPRASSPSTSRAPTTSTTVPRPLAVSTTSLALVDTSRPLMVDGVEAAPTRALPTTLVAPTTGHWPLVVFVHGYQASPATYARFLVALARRGYVVAAPSFPLEDPSRGFGLDEGDLPNEAADVSAVITSLTTSATAARLVPGAVAVVGHSDGADVALMVGYQTGVADPRVTAVVAASADPVSWAHGTGGPPLMLLHGSDDQIVSPGASDAVFDALSPARWSVTLVGADHASAIIGPSGWTASFDAAVDDFLAATVGRQGTNGLDAELGDLTGTTLRASPGA